MAHFRKFVDRLRSDSAVEDSRCYVDDSRPPRFVAQDVPYLRVVLRFA